jgi:hypothetical protein
VSVKLAFLALLAVSPAAAASDPASLAVWNVLPPQLSGNSGTLFFACKTPAGLGPLRSIIADFTIAKSHEVPVAAEDVARLRQPYVPSLRKCAADCGTTVFLARVPPDADNPNPKYDGVWYNHSLFLSRDGKTERVGHFATGNPAAPTSGETYRSFWDLAVSPDGNSYLLPYEDYAYYYLRRGNEHPTLLQSPERWGREYCGEK